MRISCLASAACCALLTPAAVSAEFKRISSEVEFREVLTEKRLESEGAWFFLRSDGKSVGEVGKDSWVGAWVWSNGAHCSNGRIGKNPETGTICHYWEVDGNTARQLLDRGNGDVRIFAIGR